MLSKTRLKYIQTLGQKKFRDSEGLFIAEGPKIVEELLREENVKVKEVLALEEWIETHGSLAKKFNITSISSLELERISSLSSPNQVLAVLEQFPVKPVLATKGRFTLALDDIQDPGNMGTIIRLADWYGIDQLVCSTRSADIYNPKVVQSTMGSIARVNCYYTDLETWLGEQEMNIYAAVLNGRSIQDMPPLKEGIMIIGNESRGISESILKLVNEKLTIPKIGKAESLNAAVATGIILSHLLK
ncbi:MAG: RNA methyltransferase [Chitinophagaceae bacterium]|nr:RNA methyltransferase [Chitinophagaceae bacterium]